MNYIYSEPEGRRLLTPVTDYEYYDPTIKQWLTVSSRENMSKVKLNGWQYRLVTTEKAKTDAEMLDTSVKEGEKPYVILKSGSVYDNRLFGSLEQARNYVAMQNPKRKWKKSDNESEMVCALYGTKFIFQPLDLHK